MNFPTCTLPSESDLNDWSPKLPRAERILSAGGNSLSFSSIAEPAPPINAPNVAITGTAIGAAGPASRPSAAPDAAPAPAAA